MTVRPNQLFSEFLSTYILVFCGTGAMVVNEVTGGSVTHVGVCLVWGFVVLAMIYAFGEISGAHMNPAVTVAFAVAKKFAWKNVAPYVLAQSVGAVLASTTLWLLFPASEWLGGTHPSVDPYFSPGSAFILEFLLTFFLMVTIINVSTGSKEVGAMAGLAIGGVVMLEALFAGPMTNASMNPARSLGPNLVSGHYHDLWIYLLAPTLGAIFAVFSCKWAKGPKCCD